MPELPEVETFRRYIERTSLRRPVREIEVRNHVVLGKTPAEEIKRATEGSSFGSARRHGKQLFLELSKGGFLTWHFGMTGEPVYYGDGEEAPRFERVSFAFDRGRLAFDDPRMLGRIGVASSVEEFVKARRLGPDALLISRKDFVERFEGTRGAVKPALMDQHKIAGIGNIYSDEVLFQSRIDPRTDVSKLDRKELGTIHRNIGKVLRASIEVGTESDRLPEDFLLRYRRKGAACPQCGGRMTTMTIGGRTAYLCPMCQELK